MEQHTAWKEYQEDNRPYDLRLGIAVLGAVILIAIVPLMSMRSGSKLTPLGVKQTWGERTVTVARWEYAEAQKIMEVELTIENPTYDGRDQYIYSAVDRHQSQLQVDVVVSDPTFVVLQIEGVKNNFRDLSLRMELPNDESLGALKLYTNYGQVSKVEELAKKSELDYYIDHIMDENDGLSAQVRDLDKQISDLDMKVQNIHDTNTSLEESKRYKTTKAAQEVDEKIRQNENEAARIQEEINALMADREETLNQIKINKAHIEDLRKQNE